MRRRFSRRQRRILMFISAGRCNSCSTRLESKFHADHVLPFSKGGPTIVANGQALCRECNLIKGNSMLVLRPWQEKALKKCVHWLLEVRSDKHFLINAAPGAGKTIAAAVIAKEFVERGEIERVIVIAPRREVVNQWAADYRSVTGRYMGKITGADPAPDELQIDLCATWAATGSLLDAFQAVCREQRTMIICDEHHHAAVEAAWGKSAGSAFAEAKFVLVLTGTPIRSDGERAVWLAYDDNGAIEHPEGGTYTLTYGEAVNLGYCRPVTFHRHEGRFTVDLDDGDQVQVSSKLAAVLPQSLGKLPMLQRALDFYRLACVPQFEPGSHRPLPESYQGTMVSWAIAKLSDLRTRLPNAGGLVIAPSIEMASYFSDLLEQIDGEKPILVHSQLPGAETKIQAFRNGPKRWIVSVAMISEGVDIPRLRILVYLPNALTELAFRQAIGRIVRTNGPDDDTRAYVIMPSFDLLENYARRVEEEMPGHARSSTGDEPKLKKCPDCGSENEASNAECAQCSYEFPKRTAFKQCPSCKTQNPLVAIECQSCGTSFQPSYSVTLNEALRIGAIVRGIDLEEAEVAESEAIAPWVRDQLLKSGDEKIIKILKLLPEESWSRLKQILNG